MARTKIRSFVVKDQIWARLKSLSKEEGRSMSELLREAINDLFKKREPGTYDPVRDQYKK